MTRIFAVDPGVTHSLELPGFLRKQHDLGITAGLVHCAQVGTLTCASVASLIFVNFGHGSLGGWAGRPGRRVG